MTISQSCWYWWHGDNHMKYVCVGYYVNDSSWGFLHSLMDEEYLALDLLTAQRLNLLGFTFQFLCQRLLKISSKFLLIVIHWLKDEKLPRTYHVGPGPWNSIFGLLSSRALVMARTLWYPILQSVWMFR